MKHAFHIASKDIRTSLSTPVVFAICSAFLVICGFFFFTLLQQYNLQIQRFEKLPVHGPNLNDWVVVPFYRSIEITLLFIVPLLGMKVFSEEKQLGTLEILIGSAASLGDIVLGKYLAVLFLVSAMLACSFIYPLVLLIFSNPEALPIFVGFFALLLFSWTICSVGVLVSSFIKNPIVSGISTLLALLVFYMSNVLTEKLGAVIGGALNYLSPATHTELAIKGVITGVDLIYFLSVIVGSIFLANRAIESQTWRT